MTNELSKGRDFVFIRGGHPHANLYLRYLDMISDEEAGFSYDDETKKLFESHIRSCGHCSFLMEGYFEGLSKVHLKKVMQELLPNKKQLNKVS